MRYTYICEQCQQDKELDLPLGTDLPKYLACDNCNGKMFYNFIQNIRESANNIIIPESFKATSKKYEKQGLYGKFNLHEKKLF